ncbi:hypothetical protein LY76DRAFT_610726 [Colletotrichum caudatum]|nr:hypothetical protein LY76DRAFT_610726 [Colletotrichum caudatum]
MAPFSAVAADVILEAWSGSLAVLGALLSLLTSLSLRKGLEETWKDEADVEWARVLDMATDVLVDDVARGVYLWTLLPRMGSAVEVAMGKKKRGRQKAGDGEHELRRREAMVKEVLSFCRENGAWR